MSSFGQSGIPQSDQDINSSASPNLFLWYPLEDPLERNRAGMEDARWGPGEAPKRPGSAGGRRSGPMLPRVEASRGPKRFVPLSAKEGSFASVWREW